MNKTTLVFGASLNPVRYAHMAVKKLRAHDHDVKAFGIRPGMIEDVEIETNFLKHENIDTLTLYLNPKRQVEYYNDILSLKPRRVIFNPGTENSEFEKILVSHGVLVEEACTLVLLSTGQY